mmetsp:Transcript_296/g.465  ORF Transcript_296/g.465 Transcript_296/m.465 type:complete len:126 (+) Transcript_296:124-501(+)
MLAGNKVIITGASSGIGEACCICFTNENARVIGTGRNELRLQKLQEKGHIDGYVVGDLTENDECERIVAEAVEKLGGLTTLINCAGVLKGGAMGSISLDNYLFNFRNNVQTVFEMMQHSIPHLQE